MHSDWKRGLGFSLSTAFMWGVLPIALKGLLVKMDTLTIVWYRFAASALIALCWYGYRHGPALRLLLSGTRLPFAVIAIAGLLANYLLYTGGLDHITPSASQIIIQLAPLFLLLGGVLLFGERLSALQWLGVAGLAVGIPLFFHLRLQAFDSLDRSYLLGVLMVTGAALSWAAYSLAQRRLLTETSSNTLLLSIYIAGTLFFMPWAQPAQITALDNGELLLLGFVALNTLIAYGGFGLAMSYWDISRVSAVITLAPLFTLLCSQLLSNWRPGIIETEAMDGLSWLGALLVLGGSALAALAKSQRAA